MGGGAGVDVSGGAGDERGRACANVRVLHGGGGGAPAPVEAGGDGLPDHAVLIRVFGIGFDAVFPLYRVGLLRGAGLGI